jgi:large subunit ribosomal protein L18
LGVAGGCGPAVGVPRAHVADRKGTTLASALSLGKDMRASLKTGADIGAAKLVGKLVAERAATADMKDVVFERVATSIRLR